MEILRYFIYLLRRMKKPFVHPNGAREDKENNNFRYGDLWFDVRKLKPITKRTLPKLNQYDNTETKMACTIVNALKDRCYTFDKPLTQQMELDCVQYAVDNHWYVIWEWWRADDAMHATYKWLEQEYPKIWCNHIEIRWDDPDFLERLDRWWMIGCTYRWNRAYNTDYQSDNKLDWATFGKASYGHRTSIFKVDWKIKVRDSAYGRPYNEYSLEQFQELLQNLVFSKNFYARVPTLKYLDDIKRLNGIKGKCKIIMRMCNKLEEQSNDDEFNRQCQQTYHIYNEKMKECLRELAKLK